MTEHLKDVQRSPPDMKKELHPDTTYVNQSYATTGNSAALADKFKRELKLTTLKAMKEMDKRVEHRSAAKEAKKSKAVLDDSSSSDEDY